MKRRDKDKLRYSIATHARSLVTSTTIPVSGSINDAPVDETATQGAFVHNVGKIDGKTRILDLGIRHKVHYGEFQTWLPTRNVVRFRQNMNPVQPIQAFISSYTIFGLSYFPLC